MPEVGSSPIQPAPGIYTSAQACKSVKSASGPLGPSSDFLVGGQLDQVAGDEARRQAHVAQDLHQQPAAVAARTGSLLQRFVRLLHARFHAHQVADVFLQPLIDGDQEIDGQQPRLQNLLPGAFYLCLRNGPGFSACR